MEENGKEKLQDNNKLKGFLSNFSLSSSEKVNSENSGLEGQYEDFASPTVLLDDWVYVPVPTIANAMTEDLDSHSTSDQERSTWLDDLTVDKEHSGVGFSYNQVYKDDAYKHEYHTFEDKCFRFKVSEKCYLYGVFDGQCGAKAAEFVCQRLPAEILLGQLDDVKNDTEIQEVLQQAYHTVENAYFASLDSLIAERTSLQQELMECTDVPSKRESVERFRAVDQKLSSGTSALVALILNEKLYIANVGNSRALLCRTDNGKITIGKLNDDHTLDNEDEVQRLTKLGLPLELMRNKTKFGRQIYTRCIGDYSLKGGYKDNEQMSVATSAPVIAEPDLEEPIDIDSSCNFLLLMSDGVYRSLVDATNTAHVSADIASMTATEFSRQSTLNGVGQAVVDRITRIHHDAFALSQQGDPIHSKCSTRADMTLLIRNLNYRLRSQSVDKTNTGPLLATSPHSAHNSSSNEDTTPTEGTPTSTTNYNASANPFFAQFKQPSGLSMLDTYMDSNHDSIVDSMKSNGSVATLDLDADGRLEPYVSFADFDAAMAAMNETERQKFEELLVPKMDCETIMEQPEGPHESMQ